MTVKVNGRTRRWDAVGPLIKAKSAHYRVAGRTALGFDGLTATGTKFGGAIAPLVANFPGGVFEGKSVMVCAKVRRTPCLGKA
jgi:hypothetical protein